MQPENQPQPDYSFLTNPQKQPRRGLLGFFGLGGGGGKQNSLAMVAGGGVVLVIFLGIIALLFGGGGTNTDRLISIIARQNELARVAEIGEKHATSAETKNYASTVKLSLISAENQLSNFVADQGRKLKPQEEASAKDGTTDNALTTAAQTNRFDEAFAAAAKSELQKYQDALRSALSNASGTREKNLLQNLLNSSQLLLETVPGS